MSVAQNKETKTIVLHKVISILPTLVNSCNLFCKLAENFSLRIKMIFIMVSWLKRVLGES